MSDDLLLSVDELVAGYTTAVVGPVTFTIQSGQILGMAGANGVGKSTILRSITGMARIFSGRIHRSADLTVCHQWQRPELPPELALLGGELFALLGADPQNPPNSIRHLMNQPLNRMSGGQYQLLQTMACVCSHAKLILLDEPTNSLDAPALEALSGMLHQLEPSRSVLLVSHEKSFLERHCSALVEVTS